MAQQIPIIPSVGSYRISTTLDGISYLLDFYWNEREEAWYMHLLEADEAPLRQGIKLVLGALLGVRERNASMPNGTFIMTDLSGADIDATFDDFGIRAVLWYSSNET